MIVFDVYDILMYVITLLLNDVIMSNIIYIIMHWNRVLLNNIWICFQGDMLMHYY